MSFPDAFADVAISSAVLHFAADDGTFPRDALRHVAGFETGRPALLPAGVVYWDRESGPADPLGDDPTYPMDPSVIWLDAPLLLRLTEELGGHLVDPLKTTVVQDQRSMTTWVVRKD